MKSDPRTDAFGITASTLCAIHCVATPIAVAMLPSVAGEVWESPLVHQICAFAVAAFCLLAANQGYKKHRDWRLLIPFAVGLTLVLVATFILPGIVSEAYEMPTLVSGSLILVFGHILNLKRTDECCQGDCDSIALAISNGSADDGAGIADLSDLSGGGTVVTEPVLVESSESDKRQIF